MKSIPILHALGLFILWVALTLGTVLFFGPEEDIPLEELISSGFSFAIFGATVTLLIYVFATGCVDLVGFTFPKNLKSWILWFPVSVVVLNLVNSLVNGAYSDFSIYKWSLVNTFFVGISEELMFRGVLLSAFVKKYNFWKGAIVISLLFGLVHVLNGFVTGDFSTSIIQACAATFSGFVFLAIRVKTLSLLPGILLHWLFDFVIFSSLSSVMVEAGSDKMTFSMVVHLLLTISPLVFGITGIIQLLKKDVVADFMATQK